MWKINQGLTSHHHWQSSPSEWPLLLRGINYWNKEHKQVYLLGNAVTWWAATLSIITFGTYVLVTVFRWHLGTPCQQINMFSISMCKLFICFRMGFTLSSIFHYG